MTEPPPVKQARDTLLLSHANPEDNEFTLWLALQLANEGYHKYGYPPDFQDAAVQTVLQQAEALPAEWSVA